MTKKLGRKPLPKRERKDQLIQTRVPDELSLTLREAARHKRITVSQLIRNVLEDTFDLVDDVIGDAMQLGATVKRDSQRIADSAKGREKRRAPAEPDPMAGVEAWQEVRLNKDVVCGQCARVVPRGERAAFGVGGDARAAKVWLCAVCAARL